MSEKKLAISEQMAKSGGYVRLTEPINPGDRGEVQVMFSQVWNLVGERDYVIAGNSIWVRGNVATWHTRHKQTALKDPANRAYNRK